MSPLGNRASDRVRRQYAFSETFATDQLRHVMEHLTETFREANEREDFKECIDSVLPSCRVARRLRRISSTGDRRDFTVRSRTKFGKPTEIHKMMTGRAKCTHYSYAWCNPWQLREIALVDMKAFLRWVDWSRWSQQSNGDGTWFVYYPFDAMPSSVVVARQVFPWAGPAGQDCGSCWVNPGDWQWVEGVPRCGECGHDVHPVWWK